MVVAAVRIGLPDLEKRIAHGMPRAVDHAPLDKDRDPRRGGPDKNIVEIGLENIEACLVR